jgi:phage recombination protein Bet
MSHMKLSTRQVQLIRNTVARDCTPQEFDVFVEMAEQKGLDPFLGQIVPIIANRGDAARRRMTLLISREGQRIIAQRCGDYRPASKPARFRASTKQMTATNPQGLISATVYLWKQSDGQWFPVAGHARWDEHAPSAPAEPELIYRSEIATLTRIVGPTQSAMPVRGDSWSRMPRLMLAKCAEMQALRAGWPAQYAGLYDEAEFSQVGADDDMTGSDNTPGDEPALSASDMLRVYWSPFAMPEVISTADFIARAPEWLKQLQSQDVLEWRHLNRDALRQIWTTHPRETLALKQLIDELSGQRPANVH